MTIQQLCLVLDAFWLVCAGLGVIDRRARPLASVLVVMWLCQKFLLTAHHGSSGELGSIALDAWAFVLLVVVTPRDRPIWALIPIFLFAPSFSVQAAYWLFAASGVRFDWPLFWSSAFIFTVQMASVASPGGKRLGRLALRHLRSVRSVHRSHRGRDLSDRAYAPQPVGRSVVRQSARMTSSRAWW